MGKQPRPDTIDSDLRDMIDRYVDEALVETGTAATARSRFARASVAPPASFDFMAPPPRDPAADLVKALAAAMAEPERKPEAVETVEAIEFGSEVPTEVDDEPTGVYSRPR